MKIPEKEIIKLGFTKHVQYGCTYYENEDMILEDLNEDDSVDLKWILMAYESMGALNASELIQKKVSEFMEENIDINEILTVKS